MLQRGATFGAYNRLFDATNGMLISQGGGLGLTTASHILDALLSNFPDLDSSWRASELNRGRAQAVEPDA